MFIRLMNFHGMQLDADWYWLLWMLTYRANWQFHWMHIWLALTLLYVHDLIDIGCVIVPPGTKCYCDCLLAPLICMSTQCFTIKQVRPWPTTTPCGIPRYKLRLNLNWTAVRVRKFVRAWLTAWEDKAMLKSRRPQTRHDNGAVVMQQ